MFRIRVTGQSQMQAALRGLGNRVRPAEVLDTIGRRLAMTEIPQYISQNKGKWPAPRRGGQPLRDTGLLHKSFIWRVEGSKLIVGTARAGANTQNTGAPPMHIRPKNAQWLTIPYAPNLSQGERQSFKLRKYEGVFFLPSRRKDRLLAYQAIGKGKNRKLRLLAVLVKGIGGPGEPAIPKREFLSWHFYADSAVKAAVRYVRRAREAGV